jgi:formate dehydrogenase alpha subunit
MANTTAETVRLTIDGIEIIVPKGTLVIEAARRVGVMIPHFCYHPKLKPDANCRMCLVEIEKMPKLQTSCSTLATEGMSVRTATTVVNEAHKSVLEFILANHPLDCPVCDQGGKCDLQDFSHQYTATGSRFIETKRIFQKEYFSPVIETQMNRCVQCLRCVRYCDEVMDVKALAPSGRGTMTEIKAFGPHPLDCEFCGGCVQICPVGAITSRLSMYEYRPWMLKRADTICQYCGDGCQITVQTKNDQLIEVNSSYGAGRNNGDLCARGFFGFHATNHPDRLTKPLIRRNGALVQATWEEALEYTAQQMARLKETYGADAFGGLISSRCTNEDLYVFQKFMRLVVGTNNLDSSARYGHVNGVQAMRRVQGTHRWTVTFEDIVDADVLLLVGTSITETNPVAGLRVKEAVKKRQARLLTIEATEPGIDSISNITNLAHRHVGVPTAQFGDALLGLVKGVVEGRHIDPMMQSRSEYVSALSHALEHVNWTELEAATGTGRDTYLEMAAAIARGRRVVVVVGQDLVRSPGGYGGCLNLLDLLLVTGKLAEPGCGIALLAEENNDQGAIEMGAVAEWLPGALTVTEADDRATMARAWKADPPSTAGVALNDMIDKARAGNLKAMLVVGENPVGSLPSHLNVAEALRSLELLVCQELFLTETAALAHVVFPAAAPLEKAGTWTNEEGHVQAVRPAIEPAGESRPDWEILSALSILLGRPLEYGGSQDVLKEIRSVIPGYGLLGPAPTPPKVDPTAVERYVTGDFRRDLPTRYTLAPRRPSKEGAAWHMRLTQSLFHSGKLSTRAKGLLQLEERAVLRMNRAEAGRMGIVDGDRVRVSNQRGELTTTVKLVERVPEGTMWFPDHFAQQASTLFDYSIDPVTKVPYFRCAQVTIDRLGPSAEASAGDGVNSEE